MGRLIDADKLLQQIKFDYDLDYGETLIDPRDFADAVCDSPTVDAVPVVRCKDCKYYKPDEYECGCDCPAGLPYVKADDFCSYGERNEDENGRT